MAEERGAGLSSGPNSAGELLQLFRTGEVATRGELQRVTGLARSTVTFRVDALLAAGYLVEDGSIVDGRGRPSTRLRVNDQADDHPGGRPRRDAWPAGSWHAGWGGAGRVRDREQHRQGARVRCWPW